MVVGVLQRRVLGLEDHLVPARGEDRGHRRLAHVAAAAFPELGDERVERFYFVYFYEMEKLLPRVREVLAQVSVHPEAPLLHLGVEDLLGERAAAAAARRGLGLLLQRAQARATRGYGPNQG